MDWAAVAAVGTAVAAAPVVAQVAALGVRARLRRRFRQARELLDGLPEGEHRDLRDLLESVVRESASQLAAMEARWLRGQRSWVSRRFVITSLAIEIALAIPLGLQLRTLPTAAPVTTAILVFDAGAYALATWLYVCMALERFGWETIKLTGLPALRRRVQRRQRQSVSRSATQAPEAGG
jgi:hypothetical protein